MAEARIRSMPDEELQYRCQIVEANGKTLATPAKAIDPVKIHPKVQISPGAKFVNEVYAEVSQINIDEALAGGHGLEYRLRAKKDMLGDFDSRISMCFLEIKKDSIPNQKEIEFITDQAYVHSDITPLPMLSNFVWRITDKKESAKKPTRIPNDSKFKLVMKYLRDSIETIEQINKKPIMGYVPDYRMYYEDLVKIYHDCGINTFYFDAHLSSPITLQTSLRAFIRELSKNGMLEKSLIHMINPSQGRAARNSEVVRAGDVLGFGLGVDILGERHMRRPLSPKVIENMNHNPDNRYRLFDKDSYGYLRTCDMEKIRTFYPSDSWINMAQVIDDGRRPDPKVQNTFNVEQLALEGNVLQSRLAGNEGMLKYVEGKSNVDEASIKVLKRAKV